MDIKQKKEKNIKEILINSRELEKDLLLKLQKYVGQPINEQTRNKICQEIKEVLTLHNISTKGENIKNVPHPICPLNMYFEGDENKCNTKNCNFGTSPDNIRSCTGSCKIGRSKTRKVGDIVKIIGHELKITWVEKEEFNVTRYRLSCHGHCCTFPHGMLLECTKEDLEELEKLTIERK